MKIGVNARLLTKPFTGIGQVTKNLFENLAKITPENEYVLVVPEKVETDFSKNVEVKILPEAKRGTAGMKKTRWEQIQVPEFFMKEKVDIAFFTYASNPWAADRYLKNVKIVVMVHDCIPWIDKRYQAGVLSKMYHYQSKKAVRKADLVLTVSEASMRDLVKVCGVDEAKIKVIYNDVNEVFKKGLDDEVVKKVLGKFGLNSRGFFFYCGGFDVRKNVEGLVEEYGKYAEKLGDKAVALVLAGDKILDHKLCKSFDKIPEVGRIVKTGFLDEESLTALYGSCLSFVHLSENEGFNIPLLEAANFGAPLILSDIPVHREIAGDFAIFVGNGEACNAMEDMMNPEVREKWAAKAKELAGHYSWEKSAQILKDVLSF